MKDRPDLQILTFNIDEELGLVAPFLKENGYTLPVVSARSFVNGLLDMVAVPQNWIIDPKGVWRWMQLGFNGADATWSDEMIQQLESVKSSEER